MLFGFMIIWWETARIYNVYIHVHYTTQSKVLFNKFLLRKHLRRKKIVLWRGTMASMVHIWATVFVKYILCTWWTCLVEKRGQRKERERRVKWDGRGGERMDDLCRHPPCSWWTPTSSSCNHAAVDAWCVQWCIATLDPIITLDELPCNTRTTSVTTTSSRNQHSTLQHIEIIQSQPSSLCQSTFWEYENWDRKDSTDVYTHTNACVHYAHGNKFPATQRQLFYQTHYNQ